MVLNKTHRRNFAVYYAVCFIISYGWLFFNHLLFHQLQPVFFLNRLDISLNLVFLTGIQKAIADDHTVRILFDTLYLLMPVLLIFFFNTRLLRLLAILHCLFNLLYALLISSFTPLSIAGFVGWILLPLVLIPRSDKGFYFSLNAMRYLFLLFMFSTAAWKIRAGGIFNPDQMSAILLLQHSAYLVHAPGDWFSNMIYYLAGHRNLSYLIYLLAVLLEFVFVIGFFTKRFDKTLMILLLVFVLFDLFLMRINYFSWVAFLGCLWFAKYEEPATEKRGRS